MVKYFRFLDVVLVSYRDLNLQNANKMMMMMMMMIKRKTFFGVRCTLIDPLM